MRDIVERLSKFDGDGYTRFMGLTISEEAAAEIDQLRADLAAERELADRMYGALEYIDDYCLAYPELESISAVSSSAIEYVDTRRNK